MSERKSVPALIPFLVMVSMIFIGILIYAYVEAKKANPQMLDEHGRVKSAAIVGQPFTAEAQRCREKMRRELRGKERTLPRLTLRMLFSVSRRLCGELAPRA